MTPFVCVRNFGVVASIEYNGHTPAPCNWAITKKKECNALMSFVLVY